MGRVVLKLNNLAIRIVVVLGKSLVEGTWGLGNWSGVCGK